MIRAPLLSNIPTVQSSSASGRNQTENHQPFSYNILLTSFACGKIIISIITLKTDSGSHQELRTWLALATICDLINAILLITDTKKLISHYMSRRQNTATSNRDRDQALDEESQQTPTGERWPPPNQGKLSRTFLILNNWYFIKLSVVFDSFEVTILLCGSEATISITNRARIVLKVDFSIFEVFMD